MKKIKLTQGKFAQVDNSDYPWLNTWKWYAQKDYNTFYALRTIYTEGKKKVISMHRLIMDTPDNMLCDHQDRNGLNCQRHNMRNATPSQNSRNTTSRLNATSKYLGVSWVKSKRKWIAQIKLNHRSIHIGAFLIEKDAAIAYDKAALEHFGEFANLNFKESSLNKAVV